MLALRVLPTTSLAWGEAQIPVTLASVKASGLVKSFTACTANSWLVPEPIQGHLWRVPRNRCLQNGGYLAAAEEDLCGSSIHVDEQEQQLLLKSLASTLSVDLKGTCIYLIGKEVSPPQGMMGSGKTTVGKILAEALGYLFFDTDALIEQAAGASVAELFSDSENNFRDAETEVLSQLSCMGHLVVATGGGAVIRPTNWGYLRHGVTVWLNVPIASLAKRVVAVGTESRPLLGQSEPVAGCAYDQVHACLSRILEERSGAYRNADAIVSLEDLALNFGWEDTCELTPTMIAVQVLREIAKLLAKSKKSKIMF